MSGKEAGCFAKFAAQGYRQKIAFQPADRFWVLQAYETAIYLALTAVLAVLCTWRTRRLS